MRRPSKTSLADYALLNAAFAIAIAFELTELGFWKRGNAWLQEFVPLASMVLVGVLVVKFSRQRESPVHTLVAILLTTPVMHFLVFG